MATSVHCKLRSSLILIICGTRSPPVFKIRLHALKRKTHFKRVLSYFNTTKNKLLISTLQSIICGFHQNSYRSQNRDCCVDGRNLLFVVLKQLHNSFVSTRWNVLLNCVVQTVCIKLRLPSQHHHPSTGTKLYCLVTEAHNVRTLLPKVDTRKWNGRDCNPRTLSRKSNALTSTITALHGALLLGNQLKDSFLHTTIYCHTRSASRRPISTLVN